MSVVPDFDWNQIAGSLQLLGLAYVFALPIAYNREKGSRSAGLRTFPLVAVASCGFTLIALTELGDTNAYARVVQGIVTGIGFIGGGAILKKGHSQISGTATAASIWATGAVGVATAFHRFEIALSLALLTFLTFLLMGPVKSRVQREDEDGDDDAHQD